jgi:hypothetical protein
MVSQLALSYPYWAQKGGSQRAIEALDINAFLSYE